MTMATGTIYLASPLGFSPETRPYLAKIIDRLQELGYGVFDPWAQPGTDELLAAAGDLSCFADRVAAFRRAAAAIGAANEAGIRQAQMLLGVLDGAEVDSGTASEIGFAAALGKRCYGLRTDVRDSGDFIGVPINLQVLHFIEQSGGRLFRSIAEIALP
jgi:nucleoside 2-deoxyribosyltransferase